MPRLGPRPRTAPRLELAAVVAVAAMVAAMSPPRRLAAMAAITAVAVALQAAPAAPPRPSPAAPVAAASLSSSIAVRLSHSHGSSKSKRTIVFRARDSLQSRLHYSRAPNRFTRHHRFCKLPIIVGWKRHGFIRASILPAAAA